jgi:polyisoprenoid-binding protein YceI
MLAPRAGAETWQLSLDPAATRIAFTLPARLHTVRGTFALERAELRFDPDSGEANGEIVVDATSGDTGIDARDRVMHEEVLASAQHPEMALRLARIEVRERGADRLAGVAHGVFRVRGGEHPIAVRFEGTRSGGEARITARFDVPWVAWGLPDPSTFLLWVEKTLAVEVTSRGRLAGR